MPRPSANPSKQLSRRVAVLISGKDPMTKTSKVVWQHEIPLLEAIWGEGNVKPVADSELDEGFSARATPDLLVHNKQQDAHTRISENVGIGYVFIGNPANEYGRLEAAYGSTADDATLPVVRFVYGRFQEGRFAPMLGNPTFADLPPKQLIDLILANAWVPHVAHDAPREERLAAAEKERQLRAMKHDELLKIAEETLAEPA